jgi:hypothetical protein
LADDVEIILDVCAAELKEKLGWKEQVASEGDADQPTFDERPPLDERIKATSYKGEFGINQAILELPIARLSEGASVVDVIAECRALILGIWEKLDDDDPDKNKWDWPAQHRQIDDSIYGFIKKAHGENARLIDALPAGPLTLWREIERRGGSPGLYKKRGLGRGAWSVKDFGPAEEIPTIEPEEIPTQPREERKYRFRLIAYKDMRPGLEPAYLVDELIPSAGLVLVWGKQKTFKSFWLLDLFLHVARGLPYRDHAVRQGTVVYCAFEGAHGFKARVEAQRRHYQISDNEEIPLYIMPGQADLIRDHKTLIADFREQLSGELPAVVVLDTLNRSLVGSESKDIDMTAYTAAAEAIRKEFGCVVIIVHHCGYDDTHARGHTSLPAAVDAELSISRADSSPVMAATVVHMRDGPEGLIIRSRIKTIRLDPDQLGRVRSSLVIEPDDTPGIAGGHAGRPDSATPTFILAMQSAIGASGEEFTPDGKPKVRAVGEDEVRKVFHRHFIDAEGDAVKSLDAQRKAFTRAVKKAITDGLVCGQKDNNGRPLFWFNRE